MNILLLLLAIKTRSPDSGGMDPGGWHFQGTVWHSGWASNMAWIVHQIPTWMISQIYLWIPCMDMDLTRWMILCNKDFWWCWTLNEMMPTMIMLFYGDVTLSCWPAPPGALAVYWSSHSLGGLCSPQLGARYTINIITSRPASKSSFLFLFPLY